MTVVGKIAAIFVVLLFFAVPSSSISQGACPHHDNPPSSDSSALPCPDGNTTNVKYWKDKVFKNSNPSTFVDYTIYLSGNLTVEHGGFLRLVNTTLILDSDYPENNITINGTLLLTKGSTVTLVGNGSYGFIFTPAASGSISDSVIDSLGANALEVWTGSVTIENTSFRDTAVNIWNSTVTMTGCRSEYAYRGICAHNSYARIINSTVEKSFYGIYASNSTVRAENSTVSSISKSVPGSYDIYANESLVSCVNTKFSQDSVALADNSSCVNKEWFVSVFVNSTNGPLSNATVSASGTNSTIVRFHTDSSGWARYLNLTELVLSRNASGGNNISSRNPYEITFSATGYLQFVLSDKNITGNSVIPIVLKEKYGSKWVFRNEDWIINKTTVANDQVIMLSGDIVITNGGSLTLSNITLLMNCTANGTYRISVGDGGTLRVLSSRITSYNTSLRYDMNYEKGASGRIADSVLEYIGYPGGRSRGLEINGSLVEMYSTELRYNYYGVFINNSNLPLMVNDRIHHSDINGIFASNSSVSMVAGEIHSNKNSGFACVNSFVTIKETVIRGNNIYSILSSNSTLGINKASIHDNNMSAYIDNTTASITESTVYNQKYGFIGKYSRLTMQSDRVNSTFSGLVFARSNVTVSNSNFSSINMSAVRLSDSRAEIHSNSMFQCGYGLFIDASFINATGNRIISNSFEGMQIQNSNINSNFRAALSSNIILNNTGAGISVQDSNLSSVEIATNRISSNHYGVSCMNSAIRMENNSIVNNSWYGLYSKGTSVQSLNNYFQQVDYDIYITENSKMASINDTFSKNNTFIDSVSSWTVSWFLWISVKDKFGTPASGSELVVRDNNNGTFEIRNRTDSLGNSPKITIMEFRIKNGLAVDFNPYNITASRSWNGNHTGWLDFNITGTTAVEVCMPDLDLPPRPVFLEQPDYITDSMTYLRWSLPEDVDLQNKTMVYSYSINGTDIDTLVPAVVINSTVITTKPIENLMDNTDYFFRIRIIDKSGQVADSNEVSIRTKNAPPPPVYLFAQLSSYNTVNLSWSLSPISDFLKYSVFYSKGAFNISNMSFAADIGAQNETNYTITGLEEFTVYYFIVNTYDTEHNNITGSSSNSNVVYIVTGKKNRPPVLQSPGVTPRLGYTTGIFRLNVTYKDIDNDNPKRKDSSGYIRADINGKQYDMLESDPEDTNFTDGKKYQLDFPYPTAGVYEFYFECNDGAASYNYTVKTEPDRFTAEKPRELIFGDIMYAVLLLGMVAAVFVLIMLLWEEKRKGKSGRKTLMSRVPGVREVNERIERRREKIIRREKLLSKSEYARTGIPDGKLRDLTNRPFAGDNLIDDKKSLRSDVTVSIKKPDGEKETASETYCGRCGAVIYKKVCKFCGASQKRYAMRERVPTITKLLMLVFIAVPLAVWGGLFAVVALNGTGFIYPGHGTRLYLVIALVAASVFVAYFGLNIRARVKHIGKHGLILCKSCGKKVGPRSKYCHYCGRNVSFLRAIFG